MVFCFYFIVVYILGAFWDRFGNTDMHSIFPHFSARVDMSYEISPISLFVGIQLSSSMVTLLLIPVAYVK